MEDEIRNIEKEAYLSMLRAFIVRSDTVSWERRELMINMREELKITSPEHKILLRRVKADKKLSQMRENRRRVEHLATEDGKSQYGHRLSHNPIIPRLFGNLSGHYTHEVNTFPSLDYPSHTPETRKGKELAGDPIRKICFRMGDNITGFSLDNKVVKYGDHSGQDHRLEESPSIRRPVSRGKELTIDQIRNKFITLQRSIENRSLDNIEIYDTEALVDKADGILNASYPDPLDMTNLEKILREHEQNLVNIISMLERGGDAWQSDDDSE